MKEALDRLEAEVARLKTPLLVGATDPYERKSAAYLFTPQGRHKVAEKVNLFPGFDAEKGFRRGKLLGPFSLGKNFLAALICYDLRFPELAKYLVTRGAKVLFVLSAWPRVRLFHYHQLLRARAIENQVFVLGANASGKVEGIELAGESVAFSPLGEELARLTEAEGLLTV